MPLHNVWCCSQGALLLGARNLRSRARVMTITTCHLSPPCHWVAGTCGSSGCRGRCGGVSSATTRRSGWSSRWVLRCWCGRGAVACDGSTCCGSASKQLGGEGTELFGRICMCSHPAYACSVSHCQVPTALFFAQDGLDVPAFYAELPHTLRTGEHAGGTGSSGWLREG